MKALVVEGEWYPRSGNRVTELESRQRKAFCGSQVWRHPIFQIKEVPDPVPDGDEVIIQVGACGICGSDIHLFETDADGYISFSGQVKLPVILGHEFSGKVVDVGKKTRNLQVGDLVTMESIQWCGLCTPCRSGAVNQCQNVELLGLSANGAFADYIAVNEKYCWQLNSLRERYTEDEIFEIGALIEPVGCAYNGIFISGGGFRPGETMAVYGVGPIGLAAVALGRIAGASKVIAFDKMRRRLELAEILGADYIFHLDDLSRENSRASQKVLALTDGIGADVQIEAAGDAPYSIPEMELAAGPRGRIIYLGRAKQSALISLNGLVSGAQHIAGARGHSGYGIFPDIIRLIAAGRIDFREMITACFPFPQILEAFSRSAERIDGKILIKMQNSH
jgi:threonine dehydrogenase-like Zn-dependent dehydrogenase